MDNDIFQVGLTIYIESYHKTRLATHVVGWEQDAFVLTKAAYIHGHPARLKPNDVCKVRFLKNGAAYGFEARIITVQFFPFPLMFFNYPSDIQCIEYRVAPRFHVDLPAEVLDAAGSVISEVVVVDISEGGCGLKVPVKEGNELPLDKCCAIKFKIMDKEIRIASRIAKTYKVKDTDMLGMQFSDIAPPEKETLALFLDVLAKHGTRS